MPFLVAAVVFVGVLCAIDLLLTVAVIRRLREHTVKLALLSATSSPGLLRKGSPLPDIHAHSVDGREVSASDLKVVAMLSTTCGACPLQMPDFVAMVGEAGHRREEVLAVVVGRDTPTGRELTATAAEVGTVIREDDLNGPVTQAFAAEIFPAFYLVENGIVRAASISVEALTQPVPA